MLYLRKKELELFKKLIGCSISQISSDDLRTNKTELSFLKLSVKLHFNCNSIKSLLFKCDYKTGFYQTYEEGILYYDYNLFKNHSDIMYDANNCSLNYSPIKKIKIYGRVIPKKDVNEFISHDKELFKGARLTDDVFFFFCENGERFMLVYGDWNYGLSFFCGDSLTTNVFLKYKQEETIYKLNHVIE